MRMIDRARARRTPLTGGVKRLVLAVAMIGVFAPAPAFFEVDGKFGGAAEGYSLGFDVSFRLDTGTVVEGGKLFFGTDTSPGGDGDRYLYFAMPKDFVDNSLGANSVGWGNKKNGHTMKDLVNSDSLGRQDKKNAAASRPLVLTTTDGTLELQVDYLAKDVKDNPSFFRSAGIGTIESDLAGAPQDNTALNKSEGLVIAGTPSAVAGVKEIATSMEYNVNRILASSDPTVADDVANSTEKNPEGYIADSPLVDASYQCDASLTGEAQAICNDWVFEVGYEFRFAAGLFGNGWDDPAVNQVIGGGTALTFVDTGESHVSPNKTGGKFQDVLISCDPTFGNGCDGGPPIPPAVTVPEPGTSTLLGLGLALLGLRRRRGRAAGRAPASPAPRAA